MSDPEPFQTSDKADVVIYDRRSGIVTTVAYWMETVSSALDYRDDLRVVLHPSRDAMVVRSATANVGSRVAEPEPLPIPQPRHASLRERRKADCLCVRCGSAELASAEYCQGCLEKANERSARSQRKLRDVQVVG